jgi:hypothetical protein
MKEPYTSKVDAARRLAELRQGKEDPAPPENAEDGLEFEPEAADAAFSILSADRQHKLMVEFRLLGGDAKALAYSYLVAAEFNPSVGVRLDFSGYAVTVTGRNLRALFEGLVAQRVAVVREMDALQAEAAAAPGAAIVTGIEIKEVE